MLMIGLLRYCSKITQKRIEYVKESIYNQNKFYIQDQVQKPKHSKNHSRAWATCVFK